MQFFFSLLVARLPLPAPAFAQDQADWNARFQATHIRPVQPAFAHRTYLERGGLTSFLGDGTLRHGRERMAELYDGAEPGAGFAITADVQRVANPGYNSDRGPASFYAIRLHWES